MPADPPADPGSPPRLGLALSGGAVRGAAHVGVLEVLTEAGIVPEVVAGTSAGAIVGAAYAAGIGPTPLAEILASTKWSEVARVNLRRTMSIFDTMPMERFVEERLGAEDFAELERPFAAVACDVTTGERIVLCEGRVGVAVRASAAVPGLFPPVEIDDRLLVDGGLVDSVPVQAARDLGATFVIAVDLNPRDPLPRPTSIRELVMAAAVIRARATPRVGDPPDFTIHPEVGDLRPWDLDEVEAFIDRGRAAAEAALDDVQTALRERSLL